MKKASAIESCIQSEGLSQIKGVLTGDNIEISPSLFGPFLWR